MTAHQFLIKRGAVGYGAFVRVDALRAALTEAAPRD